MKSGRQRFRNGNTGEGNNKTEVRSKDGQTKVWSKVGDQTKVRSKDGEQTKVRSKDGEQTKVRSDDAKQRK